MQAYGDEDYLIFDCPGQIELYSHVSVMRSISEYLSRQGFNVAAIYCLDAQFAADGPKFVAGSLQALSAMVQLELPHVNVLTKVDLLAEDSKVQHWAFTTRHRNVHPDWVPSSLYWGGQQQLFCFKHEQMSAVSCLTFSRSASSNKSSVDAGHFV